MIQYLEGDIFATPAQTIVNTVNTVGVMGKGIALEFKKRYPDMFRQYRDACEKRKFNIGNLMLFYESDYWVLLFPTKEHWRNPSRLDYIEKGLEKFRQSYAEFGITSIAFPRLGCGNGELEWDDVKPVMERELKDLPIDIYIYTALIVDTVPEHKDQKCMTSWLRQNACDLSFNGVCDDLSYNYTIIPFSFKSSGNNYRMVWKDGVAIEDENGERIHIPIDLFFSLWDQIRTRRVIGKSNQSQKNILYDMLCSLGYLTKVKLRNGETLQDGYQVNEGIGRAYSVMAREDAVS